MLKYFFNNNFAVLQFKMHMEIQRISPITINDNLNNII